MKTKLLLYLALAFSTIFSGCASAPSPKAVTMARTKPFIVALTAYHRDTGDYPQKLDDLRPSYLGVNVSERGSYVDAAHIWLVYGYERVNRDNYKLSLYSDPCSVAEFENGRLVNTGGPYYKSFSRP
jgi:hypothetical protein